MSHVRARFTLDRKTVAALVVGMATLQILMFAAGWIVGVSRTSSPALGRPVVGAPVLAREAEAAKPDPVSPLAELANYILPPPSQTVRAARKAFFSRPAPAYYAAMIREAALRHSLPPALVEAMARVESGFNPRAVSNKGARGLLQVIPATGRRFGVRPDQLLEPEHNLAAGTAYLAWLLARYDDDIDLALAAYNAGEGAVDEHGGIPPYRETRDYVQRVRAALSTIEERESQAEPEEANHDVLAAEGRECQ